MAPRDTKKLLDGDDVTFYGTLNVEKYKLVFSFADIFCNVRKEYEIVHNLFLTYVLSSALKKHLLR